MPRGGARAADKDYLDQWSTNALKDLAKRLDASLEELGRYRAIVELQLMQRDVPTHPKYGDPDEGFDPSKATQSREYLP